MEQTKKIIFNNNGVFSNEKILIEASLNFKKFLVIERTKKYNVEHFFNENDLNLFLKDYNLTL